MELFDKNIKDFWKKNWNFGAKKTFRSKKFMGPENLDNEIPWFSPPVKHEFSLIILGDYPAAFSETPTASPCYSGALVVYNDCLEILKESKNE